MFDQLTSTLTSTFVGLLLTFNTLEPCIDFIFACPTYCLIEVVVIALSVIVGEFWKLGYQYSILLNVEIGRCRKTVKVCEVIVVVYVNIPIAFSYFFSWSEH